MKYQCGHKCQVCKVEQCYLLPNHEKKDHFKGHFCQKHFPMD